MEALTLVFGARLRGAASATKPEGVRGGFPVVTDASRRTAGSPPWDCQASALSPAACQAAALMGLKVLP